MGDKVGAGASPPLGLGKAVALSLCVLGGMLSTVTTRAQSWRQSQARTKVGGIKDLEADCRGRTTLVPQGAGRVGLSGPAWPGLVREGGHSFSLRGAPTRGHGLPASRKTPSSPTLRERRLLRQPCLAQNREPRGEASQPQSYQPEQGKWVSLL